MLQKLGIHISETRVSAELEQPLGSSQLRRLGTSSTRSLQYTFLYVLLPIYADEVWLSSKIFPE